MMHGWRVASMVVLAACRIGFDPRGGDDTAADDTGETGSGTDGAVGGGGAPICSPKCNTTEYCAGPCGGPGQCTVKSDPVFCGDSISLVCGCNGVTYNNACYASVAGVAIAHTGECSP